MRRHRLLTHTDANTHSEIYARMYVHTHTNSHILFRNWGKGESVDKEFIDIDMVDIGIVTA